MPDPAQFPAAEQERVRSMLRAVDVPAPPSLHAAVQEQIRLAEAGQRRRPLRWPVLRLRVLGPALAVAAAAAAVVIIVLAAGDTTSPSLRQASEVALRQPTVAAPTHGRTLNVSVDGIPFPYREPNGWRAVGTRADTVGGRRVVTVFYRAPGHPRVGYAIVAGHALSVPAGQTATRNGIRFTVLRSGSARIVTWRREGHTCIVAGPTASVGTLLRLATASD